MLLTALRFLVFIVVFVVVFSREVVSRASSTKAAARERKGWFGWLNTRPEKASRFCQTEGEPASDKPKGPNWLQTVLAVEVYFSDAGARRIEKLKGCITGRPPAKIRLSSAFVTTKERGGIKPRAKSWTSCIPCGFTPAASQFRSFESTAPILWSALEPERKPYELGPSPSREINPWEMANLVNPATLWMSSLRMIRSRWVSIVRTPMPSIDAISLLLLPLEI